MKGIGKLSIILGSIFVVSSILSTALFFASFDFHDVKNSDYYNHINFEKKISYSGINKVEINFLSENIYVEEILGDEFIFNLTGDYPLSKSGEYPELIVTRSGDHLYAHVNYPQTNYLFGINSLNSELYVGVPEKYFGDFKIEVVSGELQIENINTNNFYVSSVSGNVEIRSSNFFEGKIESISGEISIFNSSDVTSISSVSGNVVMNSFEANKDLRISTISGDVKLDINDGSLVYLNFDSISGDFDNDFGDINGDNKIIVETTSGNLRVY